MANFKKAGEVEDCYLDVGYCSETKRTITIGTWTDRDPVTLEVEKSQIVKRPTIFDTVPD